MNNVNLIGRLTADIELDEYGKGKNAGTYGRFALAVRRNDDVTDFINCVAWNKTAEIIDEYAGKGALIGVTGSLEQNIYENKDGVKVYTYQVNVQRVDLCNGSSEQEDEEDTKKSKKRHR